MHGGRVSKAQIGGGEADADRLACRPPEARGGSGGSDCRQQR
jgi:hypothetical protein